MLLANGVQTASLEYNKHNQQHYSRRTSIMSSYKTASPTRVRSNCQNATVKEEVRVMVLHSKRQTAIVTLRFTFGEAANKPRGRAIEVKTMVKAGPAKTSY